METRDAIRPVVSDPRADKSARCHFAWMVLRYSESGQIWREMTSDEFKADLLRAPNPKCILPAVRDEILEKLWPKVSLEDTPNVIEAKKIKAHNVRALYAEIADQFFRPKSKTKAAFSQKRSATLRRISKRPLPT
ncbi:hypothetical protein G3A56_27300 (plasmid) [Rhizobium oryzihabitans]|uniref:Telomere resolvase ResT/TelK catalytic domain-containing protein n=1 Tax=Rhizobium oryzihabitans TaxID=2267833 RepID=A0A7L5BRF1_9HYPH|nr:hypothetical protein [Rhizobium oryzihabitans]QIB41507.1 hypothetical protein G3A56_27300 [Rhizobium oryzihabitans]